MQSLSFAASRGSFPAIFNEQRKSAAYEGFARWVFFLLFLMMANNSVRSLHRARRTFRSHTHLPFSRLSEETRGSLDSI